jgi:hypothetical protein
MGVYIQGAWFRDLDNSHSWDVANQQALAFYGWTGALPVVGNWVGSGTGSMATNNAVTSTGVNATIAQSTYRAQVPSSTAVGAIADLPAPSTAGASNVSPAAARRAELLTAVMDEMDGVSVTDDLASALLPRALMPRRTGATC